MTGQEIITRFELQVSDMTELSSVEELAIANRVYRKICTNRPWEFLKTAATGSALLQDATGYYITMPADFAFFSLNYNSTDNSIGDNGTSQPARIFIGANYQPYTIVNFADRTQYRNHSNIAYLDFANSKIRLLGTPPDTSYYGFDYIKFPAALTTATSPVFPEAYHEAIVFGMAVEDDILQKSPKASSYAPENQAKFDSMIADLAYWNSQLIMN